MSGSLEHSPADIVRFALISLSDSLFVGTEPTDEGAWPIFISSEPNTPDSLITIYDTAGRKQGRTQVDGETQTQHGLQFRIRAATQPLAFAKANSLSEALDKHIQLTEIGISTARYIIHAISKTTDIISLGTEQESSRQIFTLNAVVALRQLN